MLEPMLERFNAISIHAPSRERHLELVGPIVVTGISIHAPSRERHKLRLNA